MQFKTLAIAALAGLASAESVLKPKHVHPHPQHLAKMSVRHMFGGLASRQDSAGDGYQPDQTYCASGGTCAEACGAGYERCSSTDSAVHCFNPAAKQACCPGGTGDSCDDGYFCSADNKGKTWCCPNGLSFEDCAKKYGVSGGLSSALPISTSSSAYPTSSSKATTTSANSTSATSSPSYSASGSASISANSSSYAIPKSTSSGRASGSATLSGSGTSTPTNVSGNSGSTNGPAGIFALLGAAAIAALL